MSVNWSATTTPLNWTTAKSDHLDPSPWHSGPERSGCLVTDNMRSVELSQDLPTTLWSASQKRFGAVRATPQRPLPSLLGPERPRHTGVRDELFAMARSSCSDRAENTVRGCLKRGHLNYLTACTVCEVIKCPNFHCKKWVGWMSTVAEVQELEGRASPKQSWLVYQLR